MMKNQYSLAAITSALCLAGCSDASSDEMSYDELVESGLVEDGAPMHGDYEEDIDQGTAGALGLDCGEVKARQPDGNDIVGIYIGMSSQNAFEAVACANPLMKVEFAGRAPREGQRFLDANYYDTKLADGTYAYSGIIGNSGTETINVSLAGRPGEEKVINIYRSITFDEGQQPAVETLIEQLETKYPLRWFHDNEFSRSGAYVTSADGTEVRKPESGVNVIWARCRTNNTSGPRVFDYCGLAIEGRIQRASENKGLAYKLEVSMNHGAYSMRKIAEYEVFARQQNAAAQAAEVERAKSEAAGADGLAPEL